VHFISTKEARDLAVYGALRLVFGFLGRLPPRFVFALTRALGPVFYAVSRRRRRITLRNLDIAFRAGRSRKEKQLIARKSFEHALACMAGFALRDRHVTDLSLFEISADAERLLAGPHPQGVAFLSAHVGDWEMAHYYLGLRGIPTAIVTREVSNAHIDREVTRRRFRRGASTIPRRGALFALRRLLREGRAVGLIADQNCPRRKHFFEFFGTQASTYVEHARLLARASASVIFIACLRTPASLRYRIVARDLRRDLPDVSGLPAPEQVRRRAEDLVRAYLREVEHLASAHPEQGLWMHRRWKSRPTGAPWLYGDLGRPLDPALLEGPPAMEVLGVRTAGAAQ